MTLQQTFIYADRTVNDIVQQIKDDQWDKELPPDFPTNDKSKNYTLREMINYQAYDDAWIPDMLAGKTMEEAGKNKFDGDLLGDDPKTNFASIVEKACAAAQGLDDPGRTIHYSYGDYPANEALWHAIVFRSLRVHDLAKVIGVNSDLPEDLLHEVWNIVEPNAEEWRAMGVFPPKVEVPDDAPLHDRLLGLTGRQPGSAASATIQMKLELVAVPVSNVDRAKTFYVEKIGFNADHDHRVNENLRFVQLTPPGSACSIVIGDGITDMPPGSIRGLQMVIEDAGKAHSELKKRGVAVSDVDVQPWGNFIYFSDPDGNQWSLQQLPPKNW